MARTTRQYASDINQTSISAADGVVGDSGNIEYRHAQSFTLTIGTRIGSVSWHLNTTTGTPAGQMSARIESNSNGVPSGNLAHPNATSSVTPSGSFVYITHSYTPFTLPAGVYWIVLGCDNQALNNNWVLSRAGDVYAGGEDRYKADAGAWTSQGGIDLAFKVTMAGTPTRTSASTRNVASARNLVV